MCDVTAGRGSSTAAASELEPGAPRGTLSSLTLVLRDLIDLPDLTKLYLL